MFVHWVKTGCTPNGKWFVNHVACLMVDLGTGVAGVGKNSFSLIQEEPLLQSIIPALWSIFHRMCYWYWEIVLLNLLNKDERLYEGNLFRLSYLYSCLEDLDSFYNLYLDSGFKEAFSYILLLVVCLKHGDKQKAKEVFGEFLSSFKYASYIDHIWDLDDNDDDGAVEMRMTMSACYSEICSIPNFFSCR